MKKNNIFKKLAFVYSFLFVGIVALNYTPGIHDAEGNMFGLFKLDPIDDIIHITSGLWALIAATVSNRQSIIYFKTFGFFYMLDGIICMIWGQCLLDFTIHTNIHNVILLNGQNLTGRLLLNLPHLVLGGLAVYIGFFLSKKITARNGLVK
jgi:hypothetical protein